MAIGLANPYYLQIEKCLDFDITLYKNRYRLVKICKNRDGDTNILASFLFIGEIGKYVQLGKASEYAGKPPEELAKINQFRKNQIIKANENSTIDYDETEE